MEQNIDIFSLPGFTPLSAINTKDRVEAHVDGTIDVVFFKDRPIAERTPLFHISIGKEFGNEVTTYWTFGNQTVTSIQDEGRATKHYRFLVRECDALVLPGEYVLRFFADNEQVAVKYLTVKNSLIRSRRLPPSFLA